MLKFIIKFRKLRKDFDYLITNFTEYYYSNQARFTDFIENQYIGYSGYLCNIMNGYI